jgi:hypothetical protein
VIQLGTEQGMQAILVLVKRLLTQAEQKLVFVHLEQLAILQAKHKPLVRV